MRNLIAFFTKYYFFFIFLLLELICFMLIANHTQYQRSSILRSTNSITGSMNQVYTDITDYIGLKKENERLAAENAMLRSQLPENDIYYNTEGQVPILPDSLGSEEKTNFPVTESISTINIIPPFSYIPARVISNSVNKRNNYFMINKGSKDGLETDMGVMTGDGVAGIIIEVSKNYSTVMSVLHKDSRISGKIKKNGQLVNVVWGGGSFLTGKIENIPNHITLSQGDSVITSGHSHLFPEGMLIGITESFNFRQHQLFNSGTLRFSVDFSSLHHVYAIRNNNKKEILVHEEVKNDEQ